MAHTEKTWSVFFGNNPGNPLGKKDFARIQAASGALIMKVEPPKGLVGRRAAEEVELAGQFEDNVRVAAAGNDLFKSLQKLLDASLAVGLDPASPAVREAVAALQKANPPRCEVLHEGQSIFEGTHDECHFYLMRLQGGQSVEMSTAFGEFKIAAKSPDVAIEMEAGPAPAM